jgi:hypothetical protein
MIAFADADGPKGDTLDRKLTAIADHLAEVYAMAGALRPADADVATVARMMDILFEAAANLDELAVQSSEPASKPGTAG